MLLTEILCLVWLNFANKFAEGRIVTSSVTVGVGGLFKNRKKTMEVPLIERAMLQEVALAN